MSVSALSPFLASAEEVRLAHEINPEFREFLAQALRSSGEVWPRIPWVR